MVFNETNQLGLYACWSTPFKIFGVCYFSNIGLAISWLSILQAVVWAKIYNPIEGYWKETFERSFQRDMEVMPPYCSSAQFLASSFNGQFVKMFFPLFVVEKP